MIKNSVQCVCSVSGVSHRKFYLNIECSNIGSFLFLITVPFACFPFCSKAWGVLLGFFVCVFFPPFYLNTVTLSSGGYTFKSSFNYFPKASYLEEQENDRFGKYVLLPWRKQKWSIFILFTGKQRICTCPNMLLGLYVPIVHCLVCLAAASICRLAELPFAQHDCASFESTARNP